MRQEGRQLHDKEAMPEGFNRLRQMYDTVQGWNRKEKVWG